MSATTQTADQKLIKALLEVQALLEDWPTMRALSALGAEHATANKIEARRIIEAALAQVQA